MTRGYDVVQTVVVPAAPQPPADYDVVPVFYDLLARFTRSPGAIAAEIAAWERANPGVTAGEGHGQKA